MGAFGRGFRNRNPLVLLVAAVLLVPALLGFQWLFTSGVWTVVPLDVALRNPEDSFTYISWMVGRARQDPPRTPGLYLLGGSSARESIVSGGALAAEIAALGGPRVAAYDLGSINQNFAESLAVVDSAPDTPAWLLVGVNLGRFTATQETNAVQAEGREFLLKSGAVQDFVSSEWGLAEVLVHDPSGRLGVHHRLDAPARRQAARGRRRRAPSTSCTGTRRGRGARTARRSGSSRSGTRAASRSSSRTGRQPADARGAAGAGPRARRPGGAARAAAQRGDRRRQLRRRRSGSTRSRSRRSRASTARPTSTSTGRSTSPAATSRTSRISSRPGASSGNMHWRRSWPRSSARTLEGVAGEDLLHAVPDPRGHRRAARVLARAAQGRPPADLHPHRQRGRAGGAEPRVRRHRRGSRAGDPPAGGGEAQGEAARRARRPHRRDRRAGRRSASASTASAAPSPSGAATTGSSATSSCRWASATSSSACCSTCSTACAG